MSDASTRLMLPLIAAAQAQKHVTHNEAIMRLDGLVQMTAASYTTSAQPGSPSDGDLYLLPAGKTGSDWGGYTNHAVAHYYDGIWHQYHPNEGWLCFVQDTGTLYCYSGSSWSAVLPTFDAGTFTPTFDFATTGDLSVSYVTQDGAYVKIGDLVVAAYNLNFTPTYTTAGGIALPGGLPYTPANSPICSCAVGVNPTFPNGGGYLAAVPNTGGAYFRIYNYASGASASPLTATQFPSGTQRTISAMLAYRA